MLKYTALLFAARANIKVGVISDSHMNELYNPYSTANNCMDPNSTTTTVAPLSRYGCDPSPTLIDYMYMRHKEVFGSMSFILVPGDSVAHKIAERSPGDDPSGAKYDAVKANLKATADKFTEHFPNTILLPVFGNNDGRVHNNAIDETDKSDYYSFVFDLWFQ